MRASDRLIATGVFCVTLAVYVLTAPGRIDIIDGQARFDAAVHWLIEGRPWLRDPVVGPILGVRGPDGTYAGYGPAGSVFGMPLIVFGIIVSHGSPEAARFMFSFTSALFGASTAVVLFFFYRELLLPVKRALTWTAASAFGTMLWPAATSTFDNAQHATFAATGLLFAFVSARRNSRRLAFGAGVTAGALLLYQDYLVLLLPAIALALFSRTSVRDSAARAAAFFAGSAIDLALSLGYSFFRFGSIFGGSIQVEQAIYRGNQAARSLYLGNPVAGFLTLLISPGKSVFLYSPVLILGVMGIWQLSKEHPRLGAAIGASTALLVAFLSFILFVGGDWCWGPRYLTVLLPMWALAMPFARSARSIQKPVVRGLVTISILVQVIGITAENHRFFFERDLKPFFWADDPWFYFKHSALLARPTEVLSLVSGPPPNARALNMIPEPGWSTYALLGPPLYELQPTREWMKQYAVLYLPRPWVFWMWWLPPAQRVVNIPACAAAFVALGAFGIVRIRRILISALVVPDAAGS